LTGTKRTLPLGGAEFGRRQCVDIHCHCLPAVDDGPATMSEALALCEALVDDGMTDVIATPHQLGRFNECNDAAQIRERVSILNEELRSNNIALTVTPGADVRIDERICQLLEDDRILTLADGGKYILLELPHQIFIDIEPLLVELSSLGVQAIISHPERHSVLVKQPEVLLRWLKHSAGLQVTSASLLGGFGIMAQKAAWQFLSSGWASLVATDSHDLNVRKPCMRAAFERISIKLGETAAQLVCVENPLRVLKSQDMVAISLHKHKGVCNDEKIPRTF
jgi:protein-tyrosine phosphatase